MKNRLPILSRSMAFPLILSALLTLGGQASAGEPQYTANRAPLTVKPYLELPLGSIRAKGWLQEMLTTQRDGMTGHMDELFPAIMDGRNGWLGGDGDQWERGPYWIDGLLPLAYLLDDADLKKKVLPWVEWTLKSQKEDGSFGPDKDYPNEWPMQRTRSADWWPRMVMLKVMMQYHSATGDPRVIDFMSRYFRYQLATLPSKPLDQWSHWSLYRASDNLIAVYWLYNITGEKSLLDLGALIHKQAFDFTGEVFDNNFLSNKASIHCVNLAQCIKEPVIFYQQTGEGRYLDAVRKGFADVKKYNGWPNGMYGGDETLHGADPTQGTELCSIVEMMYSLGEIFRVTGDPYYAEYLERVTFNALPTQITDDFSGKQYFQQANQIECSRKNRNFHFNHAGTDNVFGLLTGYTCCTSNLHQGWPKFVQNLWYATPDGGLAAMVYSPCEVEAKVNGGATVSILEQTAYPFEEKATFTVTLKGKQKTASFPLRLRIPSWCKVPVVKVNGTTVQTGSEPGTALIDRTWKSGDKVELEMPMHVTTGRWHENALSVERGPLVYALKIKERWEKIAVRDEDKPRYGDHYWEVYPESRWNYGILNFRPEKTAEAFTVTVDPQKVHAAYPWNPANAPIEIRTQAKQIPTWTEYNGNAGPTPWSPVSGTSLAAGVPTETITLIPYGCTTLRISEFPMVGK